MQERGDGSLGEVLTVQGWGPTFGSPAPTQVRCGGTCLPPALEGGGAGGSLKPPGQLGQLGLQAQWETLS